MLRIFRILFLLLPLSLTNFACSNNTGISVYETGVGGIKRQINTATVPVNKGPYLIDKMDVLQIEVVPGRIVENFKIDIDNTLNISFHIDHKNYTILPGDKLTISFISDHTLDFAATVRPDGKITLPRLGTEINATGKSALDLANQVTTSYASIVADAKAVITVQSANLDTLKQMDGKYRVRADGRISLPYVGEIEVLGKSIAKITDTASKLVSRNFRTPISANVSVESLDVTPFLGFDQNAYMKKVSGSRTTTVNIDGMISIPNIGTIKAEGKTISKLADEIKLALMPVYQNPVEVTVSLISSPSQIVYVGGQVGSPGRVPYVSSLTLLQAISSVGSVNNEGDLSSVKILRPSPTNGKNIVIAVNLLEVIDGSHPEQDIHLQPHDTVFVERTGISKADLIVDQYINKLIPFNKSVNYTYGQIMSTTLPVR